MLAVVAALGGCGVIPDRSDRYQFETRTPPLKKPEWIREDAIVDRFPVPRSQKAFVATGEFKVPPPPVPGAELLQDQFAIKTAGSDVWLSATEPPGRIWPAVTRYWQEKGAFLEQQSSADGRLVCRLDNNSLKGRELANAWGLDPERNPLVETTVVQGIRRSTTEVRVRIIYPLVEDQTLAKSILDDVMTYLADNQNVLESYSLAAQNLSGPTRAEVMADVSPPYLLLDLPYERAWVAVGQALNAGKVKLVDLDQTQGEYFVHYLPGEENSEPGWWDWLTGSKDDGVLSDQYNFRIRLLKQDTSGVRVQADPAGEISDSQDNVLLLNRILENLS
jgi:outer membrane protein assembly factor BamC